MRRLHIYCVPRCFEMKSHNKWFETGSKKYEERENSNPLLPKFKIEVSFKVQEKNPSQTLYLNSLIMKKIPKPNLQILEILTRRERHKITHRELNHFYS